MWKDQLMSLKILDLIHANLHYYLETYGSFGDVNLENVFGIDFCKVLGFFGSSAGRIPKINKSMQ